jgi:SH3-like domain-containing protein
VLFTVESGTALTGYSTVDQWVRVADEGGRSGWIFVTLVGRRDVGAR